MDEGTTNEHDQDEVAAHSQRKGGNSICRPGRLDRANATNLRS